MHGTYEVFAVGTVTDNDDDDDISGLFCDYNREKWYNNNNAWILAALTETRCRTQYNKHCPFARLWKDHVARRVHVTALDSSLNFLFGAHQFLLMQRRGVPLWHLQPRFRDDSRRSDGSAYSMRVLTRLPTELGCSDWSERESGAWQCRQKQNWDETVRG